MIERKDIEKLAALARITIPEEQMEKVRKDIDTILAYVDQIKEVTAKGDRGAAVELSAEQNYHSGVKNVMRDDSNPHVPGVFTDKILKSAPKSKDGYIEVKKILQ